MSPAGTAGQHRDHAIPPDALDYISHLLVAVFPFAASFSPRNVTEAEPCRRSTSDQFRLATTAPNPCTSSWLGFGAECWPLPTRDEIPPSPRPPFGESAAHALLSFPPYCKPCLTSSAWFSSCRTLPSPMTSCPSTSRHRSRHRAAAHGRHGPCQAIDLGRPNGLDRPHHGAPFWARPIWACGAQ
jgi:hypothetical protein